MNLELISNLITQVSNYPYLIILATLWTTYAYVIFKSGFCSDDLAGIEQYDGTLMYPRDDGKKDDKGQVIKERKICYGTLSKWVRYHLCGGHFPSRHRYPDKLDKTKGDVIPSGKVPSHHHTLSVIVQSIACILLYSFLTTITTPTVALLTTCLFIVHPTCVQAVAWPSAIGYILSLLCICASLNISHWIYLQNDLWMIILGLGGLAFFQVWGVYAQAIPMTTFLVMLVLGQWQLAIVSGLISAVISYHNLGGYVNYRKEEFKKQQMAASTHFGIRKPIVALKTLAYYIYLTVLPMRLGLYHVFCFHWEKKMELWDWRGLFWLAIFSMSVYLFFSSPLEIKLGIIWFYSFIFLFLNWITAQQWVTERYLYIPIIGLSLISSYFLQHFLPLYFLIFGLMMARTLCHLPTYDNELRFYLSNIWNFPKSEVAYGNLCVAYASMGLGGASTDMWTISGAINPNYDVPFYNIYSRTKSNAMLQIQNGNYEGGIQGLQASVPMLEKVLACKILHFPGDWQKELDNLKASVSNPVGILVGEMERLTQLKGNLNLQLSQAKDLKRQGEVLSSVRDNEAQIERLKSFLSSRGIILELNPEKALLSKLTQRR